MYSPKTATPSTVVFPAVAVGNPPAVYLSALVHHVSSSINAVLPGSDLKAYQLFAVGESELECDTRNTSPLTVIVAELMAFRGNRTGVAAGLMTYPTFAVHAPALAYDHELFGQARQRVDPMEYVFVAHCTHMPVVVL